jgi:hypothetical protein
MSRHGARASSKRAAKRKQQFRWQRDQEDRIVEAVEEALLDSDDVGSWDDWPRNIEIANRKWSRSFEISRESLADFLKVVS